MSAEADMIIEKISQLSVDDLIKVRARIDEEISQKKDTSNQGFANQVKSHTNDSKPLIYRRSPEEVEAFLNAIFTPEELAEIGKRDFTKRKFGPKSLSQTVIEDREDRL